MWNAGTYDNYYKAFDGAVDDQTWVYDLGESTSIGNC